jgi:transcriptional regulator with XRE-family HTH domain
MKKLKELRVAANYTQEQLAEKLRVSQQTIARWESGKAEPSIKALRDIAVLFGTSVDDLLEMGRSKITTNHYLPDNARNQDGFWGHIGLMLPNEAKSAWFPITSGESRRVMQNLQGTESGWVTVSTLNNRVLAFNPSSFKKISLVDDNEDQISDDWDVTWDGYQGYSPEIYKALEMRLSDAYSDEEFNTEYSDAIRETVDEIIKDNQLSDGRRESLVLHTHIHHTDGMTSSFIGEPNDLIQISECAEDEVGNVFSIAESGCGRYFFFASSSVRLIDMPQTKIEEARKDIFGDEHEKTPSTTAKVTYLMRGADGKPETTN